MKCPVCGFEGEARDFRAFKVGLAQSFNYETEAYIAPVVNTPMKVCPKCGVAFL